MRIIVLVLATLMVMTASAQQRQALSPLGEKIKAAMDSDTRRDADRARDANRKPIATLEFLGLEDDMTVIEVLPGGGWYTSLLGPVLRDQGKLYIGVGASRVNLDQPGLDKVERLDLDVQFSPTDNFAIFDINEFSFGVEDADMVLTFRNLHNLSAAGRAAMNKAAFEALRPSRRRWTLALSSPITVICTSGPTMNCVTRWAAAPSPATAIASRSSS